MFVLVVLPRALYPITKPQSETHVLVCCAAKQSTKGNNMKVFGTCGRWATVVCGLALGMAQHAMAEEIDYQPLSLSAEAGTTGLGGSLGWRFSDHLGVRVGGHYFSYDHSDEIEGVTYDANLKLQSFPIGLDIYTSKSSSFRITVGALINQNKLTGTQSGTTVDINGNPYATDLTLGVEWPEIAPYLSLGGTIYFDSGKHVGLGLEFGVAYTGNPDVTLTASNPAVPPGDLEAERLQIEDSLQEFKFWPIIKIGLTISF